MFSIDPIMIAVLGGLGIVLFLLLNYWYGKRRTPSASMQRGRPQMDLEGLSIGLRQQLMEQLRQEQKVEAIDLLRREKDWRLKRAKQAVEALAAGQEYQQYLDLRAQAHEEYPSPELQREVERLVSAGQKIEAVHMVRQRTDWGLKRAKEYVEELTQG